MRTRTEITITNIPNTAVTGYETPASISWGRKAFRGRLFYYFFRSLVVGFLLGFRSDQISLFSVELEFGFLGLNGAIVMVLFPRTKCFIFGMFLLSMY